MSHNSPETIHHLRYRRLIRSAQAQSAPSSPTPPPVVRRERFEAAALVVVGVLSLATVAAVLLAWGFQ